MIYDEGFRHPASSKCNNLRGSYLKIYGYLLQLKFLFQVNVSRAMEILVPILEWCCRPDTIYLCNYRILELRQNSVIIKLILQLEQEQMKSRKLNRNVYQRSSDHSNTRVCWSLTYKALIKPWTKFTHIKEPSSPETLERNIYYCPRASQFWF